MIRLPLSLAILVICCSFVSIHGAQTFWPASVPLAVRTPYLNTWTETQAGNISTNEFPFFWNKAILGWMCYIRVDGTTYSLFGNYGLPSNFSVTEGALLETGVTPTRTIQVIEAGKVNVTVTFLSPIDPSDLVRQSLPFAYTAVDFVSIDGQPHDIQLYSDISGEWLYGVSERSTQMMTWSSPTQTNSTIYHQLQLAQPSPFQEVDQQASDGIAYHAMALEPGRNITWQTCEDTVCREEFIRQGRVDSNNNNDTFRDISLDWPVFPIAVDLGSIASLSAPVVWVIGYVRDPSISYTLSGSNAALRPYYTTTYNSTEAALEFFVSDFNNSLNQAVALDEKVRKAAANISADGKLYNMLSLATRKAFSSLDFTAPQAIDGNAAQTRIFMKDMGFSRRVTPVENLYAALPMFLYYNASLIKPLLVPLLEQQNSSIASYAAKDLGPSFPVVSGPTLVQQESVEQTANMLIIALAHAQYSNDTSLLHDYYHLLKGWADFLKQHIPFPVEQTSIDDGSSAQNSTNLSVKGIFAIRAMAEISHLVDASDDSQEYTITASSCIETWQSLALSPGDNPSVFATFGLQDSWCLPYNIYAETLFGFNLLNQTFLDKLTVAYGQLLQSTSDGFAYGLPINSARNSFGNLAWNAFTAATFTDDAIRAQLLDALWTYASDNTTTDRFSAVYNVESGQAMNGTSSPALGGLFAPFIRSRSGSSSSNNPGSPYNGKMYSRVGAISGGVVGGVVVLLMFVGLVVWCMRRRKARKTVRFMDATNTKTELSPFVCAPTFAPRTPAILGTEKHRRENEISTREEARSLLVVERSPFSPSGEPVSSDPAVLSTRRSMSGPRRLSQDELLGLRSEIEDLRRIMLNAGVDRQEPSDLGAPPEYS